MSARKTKTVFLKTDYEQYNNLLEKDDWKIFYKNDLSAVLLPAVRPAAGGFAYESFFRQTEEKNIRKIKPEIFN